MRLLCVQVLLVMSTCLVGQVGCSIDYSYGRFLNEEVDKINDVFKGLKIRTFFQLKRDRIGLYFEYYEGDINAKANVCNSQKRFHSIKGYGLEYDLYLYKGDFVLDGFYFIGRVDRLVSIGDLSSMGEDYVGKLEGSNFSFGFGFDANLNKNVAIFFQGIYNWPTINSQKANVIDYWIVSIGLSFKL